MNAKLMGQRKIEKGTVTYKITPQNGYGEPPVYEVVISSSVSGTAEEEELKITFSGRASHMFHENGELVKSVCDAVENFIAKTDL